MSAAADRIELAGLARKERRRRLVRLSIRRLTIITVILLALAPGYFIVLASLQSGSSFFAGTLLPSNLTLENYKHLFTETSFPTWVKNSVIVCTVAATLSTVCAGLMAYAFSRLRFVGRRYGLMALLLIQMFPIAAALPAYYYFLLRLSGWTDGHIGLETYGGLILILTGSGLAFYAWLFKGYLEAIPRELEEAAFVDGATRMQTIRFVIAPLVRPMLAVVFLLVFIATYSEYALSSLVITARQARYTLPLGLRGFIVDRFTEHWSEFAAAAVIGSLPLMAVFLLMQRHLVSGLARGAVKG